MPELFKSRRYDRISVTPSGFTICYHPFIRGFVSLHPCLCFVALSVLVLHRSSLPLWGGLGWGPCGAMLCTQWSNALCHVEQCSVPNGAMLSDARFNAFGVRKGCKRGPIVLHSLFKSNAIVVQNDSSERLKGYRNTETA